jgi:hypothetical protein
MRTRIAVPPLAACVLVALYLLVESFGFRGLAAAEASTVAEAAAMGHAARALQLMADGQNPNEPQHISAGILDSNQYQLRPLEAAIVGRHVEMMRLLQRSGAARFDLARAACLARARLPEALPDLNAPPAASPDAPTEISEAIKRCR